MYLLIAIVLALLLLVLLVFTIATRITFTFNSQSSELQLVIRWLYPFLKTEVTLEETSPVLNLYIFNKKILRNELKLKHSKPKKSGLLTAIHPTDIDVHAVYGFKDPFATGVIYGITNILSAIFQPDRLQQSPDFAASTDYIMIDATARLNMGTTLVHWLKA